MPEELDSVVRYGKALGLTVLPRTVLVEGTTDVALFQLAARLESQSTGRDLLGSDLAVVAAGEGNRGGVEGVIRELIALRGIARTCLLPNGRPRYRFIGLFDNDYAGRGAISLARRIDSSILEFKDLFRLLPVMPLPGSQDPGDIRRRCERANEAYKGLDWEVEDLIRESLWEAFLHEYPFALRNSQTVNGRVHRNLTTDGKARLHRYVRMNAMHCDLIDVIEVLRAVRFYLGLTIA